MKSSGKPNSMLQLCANSLSASQVFPKSAERSTAMAAGRGDLNTRTTWDRQNRVSRSNRISSCSPCMPMPAADAHQVSGCKKGSSVMWADGWGSSGQRRSGITQVLWCKELFPQQLERVKRVLPVAKFLIGGLQAWPSHLETDTEVRWSRTHNMIQTSVFTVRLLTETSSKKEQLLSSADIMSKSTVLFIVLLTNI